MALRARGGAACHRALWDAARLRTFGFKNPNVPSNEATARRRRPRSFQTTTGSAGRVCCSSTERGSDTGADHMPADASVSSGAESRPSVERALAITRKAGAASNCWPWALGRSLYGVGTDSPTLSEDRLARPQNDSNDMMDAAEVAELLGVPTGWVYEQSRKGLIPGRAWPLPTRPPLVARAVDRGTGEQPAVQRGRPQAKEVPSKDRQRRTNEPQRD